MKDNQTIDEIKNPYKMVSFLYYSNLKLRKHHLRELYSRDGSCQARWRRRMFMGDRQAPTKHGSHTLNPSAQPASRSLSLMSYYALGSYLDTIIS